MPPQPSLSRSEWQAVAIALKDADGCGCAAEARGTRFGRLWSAVTGNAPARPLANPRLEAVRRFVCATRRLHRRADRYVPDLMAQGFNPAQVDALTLLSA